MSRNKEKNQSGLHRFYAEKEREAGVLELNPSVRPRKVQSVTSLPQAERWRQTIIAEISVKMAKVNDPAENESEIRSVNDELNRLHREKRAWEHHIVALGGNDHLRYGAKSGAVSIGGVQYFGRAKELLEARSTKKQKVESKSFKPPNGYYISSTVFQPSIQTLMAEVNGALGEKVLNASMGPPPNKDHSTSEDIRRELLALRKAEVAAQLQ